MKNQQKINAQLDIINATNKGYKEARKSGVSGFLAKMYAVVARGNIRGAKSELNKLRKQ